MKPRSWSWILLCLGVASSAHGEPRDTVAADALFREGRALMKSKKLTEACPKLAESYRLDPAIGTLFNLAQCEEELGALAHAFERWQSVVDALSVGGKLADKRLPVARQHVADLERRVPKLTLRVRKDAPVDTIVLRDGVELKGAGLDVALPVDPGPHVIIARAAYRHDAVIKLSIEPGDRKELDVAPGEEDGTRPKPAVSAASSLPPPVASSAPAPLATVAPPPPPAAATTSWRRPAAFVGFGVAGVGFAGAAVTGLMLQSRKSTVDAHCVGKVCDAEGASAASSGSSLLTANTAFWALGLVGTGAGVYFLLSDKPNATGITVGPAVGGGGTMTLRGSL